MVDDFVPDAVVRERMDALTEVVERHGKVKHAARLGRVEPALVEGPSKKEPAVTTARTPQNNVVPLVGYVPV